jgi:hypothetical protein
MDHGGNRAVMIPAALQRGIERRQTVVKVGVHHGSANRDDSSHHLAIS